MHTFDWRSNTGLYVRGLPGIVGIEKSVVLCLSQVGGRGLQSSTLKAAVGGHEAYIT